MTLREILEAATSEAWEARLVLFIAVVLAVAVLAELARWVL